MQVRVNDPNGGHPLYEVFDLGSDGTIARHGIHGLYQLISIDVYSSFLVKGDNTIYLTQASEGNQFLGLLYDYLRLEGPAD